MRKPMKLKKILPLIDFIAEVRIYLADEDPDTPAYEGTIYETPYYLTTAYINSGTNNFEPIETYLTENNKPGIQIYVTEDPNFQLKQ